MTETGLFSLAQRDAQRKRYAELNILRKTVEQQTQALLARTIKGTIKARKCSTTSTNLLDIPSSSALKAASPQVGGEEQNEGSYLGSHLFASNSERPDAICKSSDKLDYRTLLRHVFMNNRATIGRMVIIDFVIALLSVLLTVSIGHVIAHHLDYVDISKMIQFVFFLAGIGVSIGMFSLIRIILFAKFEVSIIYHAQSFIMERLFKLPLAFFEQYATGDLCHRVLMIEPLARLSGQNQIGILLSFTFATMGFLTMLCIAWKLTLTTLAIVTVYLVFSIVNIKKQMPYIESYMSQTGDKAAFTFNLNAGMSRIRLFCSDIFAKAMWAQSYCDTRQTLSYVYRLGIWRFAIANSMLLFTLMVVFFVATRWEQNQQPLEYYVIFYSAFIQFMCGLISFSMQLNELAFTICMFRRLKPILNAQPENTSRAGNTTTSPLKITGAISISNVQFSYPNSSRHILDGLNCSIAKGEHVAIVGCSGAGKSTLFKLLLGFYFAQEGRVLFDNKPLQQDNASEVRQQISVVFQDSKLMTGTLLTNIIEGYPEKTEDDAWYAAELVGLGDFIASLPMKMHTMVSQQHNVLSGGQRQLILIARALVGKPRLLLLDEATNSLDPTTQHHIANIIRRLPITCISIAHRLSTIQCADKILVLHNGRIIEEGTYHQLLQRKGLFYQLAITQKLHSQWQEKATVQA